MERKYLSLFLLVPLLVSTMGCSDAVSDAIFSTADHPAALKLLAEMQSEIASQVLEIGIGAGIANSSQPKDYYDNILEDDDIVFLQDASVAFNNGEGYDDYDISEIVALGSDSPSIETSLSTDTIDKGYGSKVVLETTVDSIFYYYRFDDPINVSLVSETYPLEIDLLGHHLKITGVDYDAAGNANIISLRTGENFYVAVGDSVIVDGHTVKLESVASEKVAISVDGGEVVPINEGSSKAWMEGVEVTVDSIFYKGSAPETSTAKLIIGENSETTYQNNEEFIGEPEDDEQWRWAIDNLDQDARTEVTGAGTATGPVIGVKNYFSADSSSDDPEPLEVGECFYLTQGSGAQLCITGITPSNYATVDIDFATADLRDAGGSFAGADAASTPVLRMTLTGEESFTLAPGDTATIQNNKVTLIGVLSSSTLSPIRGALIDGKVNVSVNGRASAIIEEGSEQRVGGVLIKVQDASYNPSNPSISTATLLIKANAPKALIVESDNLVSLSVLDPLIRITSDVETDTIYIYKNNTPGGFNHPLLDIFYVDDQNDVRLAGSITSDGTGAGETMNSSFAHMDYGETKGEDVQFWFNMAKGGTSFFYLNITSGAEERVTGGWGHDNISINLQNSTQYPWWNPAPIAVGQGEFDRLGDTANTEEVTDMWYENSLYAAEIGTTDADLRTEYGIVIKNPETYCADDEVELLIPGDAVRAKVAILSQGKSLEGKAATIPTIELAKSDAEISSVGGIRDNSIIIGGPAANKWTAYFMNKPFPTDGWAMGWSDGWCHIKEYLKDDKTVTVVAGFDQEDTLKCVDRFLSGSVDYNQVMPSQ